MLMNFDFKIDFSQYEMVILKFCPILIGQNFNFSRKSNVLNCQLIFGKGQFKTRALYMN